jgi:hypothetical protein
MDRLTKPSGRHAVRLRWDEIITRLSYRFNFLAIRDTVAQVENRTTLKISRKLMFRRLGRCNAR